MGSAATVETSHSLEPPVAASLERECRSSLGADRAKHLYQLGMQLFQDLWNRPSLNNLFHSTFIPIL